MSQRVSVYVCFTSCLDVLVTIFRFPTTLLKCTHVSTVVCCVFRSKIRIRDGRAKPIDLLAKYISAEDDDLAVEMHEPYTFLNGLTVTDMDDLLEDIKVCC